MVNKILNDKNISIGRMIITLFMLVIVIAGGTFAWLTFSSKQSALVLTIGDINDTQIKLSPYQVTGSIAPGSTHTSGVYSEVEVTKGNNNSTSYALFYKINQLDTTLIDKGLSYTIVNANTGATVKTGRFSSLIDTSKPLPDEVLILDENTNTTLSTNTSLKYKVYLWVDSSVGNQNDIQNSTLDMELNGSIGSVTITGNSAYGQTLTATLSDMLVDTTTPYKYQWYYSNTSTTKGGTAISGATSSSYTIGSGYVGKFIYVVVTSDVGKTLSDVTDSSNNLDVAQSCDNFVGENAGKVERAVPILTLSTSPGAVESGYDNTFTTTITKPSNYNGAAFSGTLTSTSSNTSNVTIVSGASLALSSGQKGTIQYHGKDNADAQVNVSQTFKPSSTANLCNATATYTINKTDTLGPGEIITSPNPDPGIDYRDIIGVKITGKTATMNSGTQTVTFTCSDIVGVTGWYFGTKSSPVASDFTTIAPTKSHTGTVSATSNESYYVFCKDANGNVSKKGTSEGTGMIQFYNYTVDQMVVNPSGTEGTYNTSNYTKFTTIPSSGKYILPAGATVTRSSIKGSVPTNTAAAASDRVASFYIGMSKGAASTATSTLLTSDPTITANTTYVSWWKRKTYDVVIATGAHGKTSVAGQRGQSATATSTSSTGTITVRYDEEVTATGTPDTGYHFNQWSGLGTGSTNPLKINIDKNGTLTGSFAANVYSLAYSLNGGTNGTYAPTSATFDTSFRVSNPTKGNGYTFTGWTFNGDTSTAKTGTSSNSLSSWSSTSTKTKNQYFMNLTPKNAGTVTMTAHWEKTVTGTFYYYDGSKISSTTSKCTMYDSETTCTLTVPSVVSSSSGVKGGTYVGVSTSFNSMSTSSLTVSNNTTYYSIYRKNVTVYKPSSTTTVQTLTWYRNEYFVDANTMDSVFSSSKTGITNGTIADVSGYSFAGFLVSAGSSTGTIVNNISLAADDTRTAYYVLYNKSVTATFYYYDSGIKSSTASAKQYLYCVSTTTAGLDNDGYQIPVTVSNFTSQYGAKGIGWASSTNTMSTTTPSTANTKFYAVYRKNVTVYRMTSTSAATSETWYRNAYFSSTSAMTTRLATSNTSTSNGSVTQLSDDYSFAGFATAINSLEVTYQTVDAAAKSTSTTLYALSTTSITGTIYYQTSTTSGTCNISTADANGTRTFYIKTTSSVSYNDSNFNVPNVVKNSVGKYNAAYNGVYTSPNSMATTELDPANKIYYANYSSTVTIYRPSSTSAATSQVVYRNEWLASTSTCGGPVLADSKSSTANISGIDQVSGYSFYGFATETNTATKNYSSIAAAAESSSTTLYSISSKSVTATFYYYNSGIKTSTASATQYLHTKSTSASTFTNSNITAPVTITNFTAQYGSKGVGWASSTNTMTTITPSTANTKYYGVYSIGGITIYRPSSTTTATSESWYRNAYFISASEMTTSLNPSSTAAGDGSITQVSGYSFKVLSTSPNKTLGTEGTDIFPTIYSAANTTNNVFYAVSQQKITGTFYYYDNSVKNTTLNAYRYLYCTSQTSATILNDSYNPSQYQLLISGKTAQYGSKGVGWATSTGTMSTIGVPNASNNKFYAVYSSTVTIYRPSSTTAMTSEVWNRNAYFSSTSAMTTILNSSSTATSNGSITQVTGYTFAGFATATNSRTVKYSTVAKAATSTSTTLYALAGQDISRTIYYQSSTTLGTCSVSSTSATGTRTLYSTSTSAATTHDGALTVPDVVINSVGKYNAAYNGVYTSHSTMSSATPTTADGTTYYANYSSAITVYRPSSTTAATSQTIYRNEWLTSTSACVSEPVIGSSKTATTSNASISQVSGYSFYGLATATNTATRNYSALTELAKLELTTLYSISHKTVTATFYYYNSGIKSSTASQTQYLHTKTKTTSTLQNNALTAPVTITNLTSEWGAKGIGWASSTNTMSTTTISTAYTKYYGVYSIDGVKIYRPSSTSSCTNDSWYRNAYFSSTSAMTTRLASSSTSTSNGSLTQVSGYSFAGLSTSFNTYSSLSTIAAAATSTTMTWYAVSSMNMNATFYYYNSGIKSATASSPKYLFCTSATGVNSVVTSLNPPVEITNTTSQYGAKGIGWATNTNTMSTTTFPYTPSSTSTVFYGVYRGSVTLYRPSSTTTTTKETWYRNAYFTSASAMTTILNSSSTATLNGSITQVTDYTFAGVATAVNTYTPTYTSMVDAASSTYTTFYGLGNQSKTGTFYYQSSTQLGTCSVTSATSTGTRTVYSSGTSTASTYDGAIAVPSAVKNSKGKYNAKYKGVYTSHSSMSTMTPTTANLTYYTNYSSTITVYRPSSTTAATSQKIYRNEWLTSTSACVSEPVIGSSNTAMTSNASIGQVSGYSFYGLATATNSATRNYSALTELTKLELSTLYSISHKTVTATFYYYNSGIKTSTASATQYLHTKSTSASTFTNSNITAPVTVTNFTAQYGSIGVGWASSTNTMTTITPSTANTKYYGVYSIGGITIYRPSSTTTATSESWYRNAYFSSTSSMTTALNPSSTTAGNGSITQVSGYSFKFLSTSPNKTTGTVGTDVFETIAAAATTTNNVFYEVSSQTITGTFYYYDGGVKNTTKNSLRYLYCTSQTAATILNSTYRITEIQPLIDGKTAQYGSVAQGWATNTGTMSTISTPDASNNKFYAVYRSSVTVYRASSLSAMTKETWYRNAYFSSTSAMTTRLATSTSSTSNGSVTQVTGYSFAGFATATNSRTVKYSSVDAAAKSTSTTLYALAGKDISRTIYYQSSTTLGTCSVTSTSGTGTRTLYSTSNSAATTHDGNLTVPDAVKNSKGKYNAAYKGVFTAHSSMSITTPTTADNTEYYANYSSTVTIYRPSSTTAATSQTVYRNEWLTSTSACGESVLGNSNTATTSITSISQVSGYSFYGFATATNSTTRAYASISDATKSSATALYSISNKIVSSTLYYYYGEIKSTSASGTRYLYTKSTTAATIKDGNLSLPSNDLAIEISGSVGPYNSIPIGWSTSLNSMSGSQTPTTASTVYYLNYRRQVTIYNPSSTSACSEETWYRNEFFTNTSTIKTVLSKSTSGTSNGSLSLLSGYSLFSILSNNPDETQWIYSFDDFVKSTYADVTLWIEKRLVNTFYYYNNGIKNETTEYDAEISCMYNDPNVAHLEYSSGYLPTVTITNLTSEWGANGVGWASSTNTMSTVTVSPSLSNATYYGVYRDNVSERYSSATSANLTRTVYRNAFFKSTTAMSTVLSDSSTGTANYSVAAGYGGADWLGFATTSTSTTSTYSSVDAAAKSTSIDLYTLYKMSITYKKGSNVSSIGSTNGECVQRSSESSCSVTLPSITANPGYTPVGWNTTSSATTGTAAGSTYTLSSDDSELYANAIDVITPIGTLGATAGDSIIAANFSSVVEEGSGVDHYTFGLLDSSNNVVVQRTDTSNPNYTFTNIDAGTYKVVGKICDKSGNCSSEYSKTVVLSALSNAIPVFTYDGDSYCSSGKCTIVNDSEQTITNPSTYTGNWKIRFTQSAALVFSDLKSAASGIDIFVVGGGGNGGYGANYIGTSAPGAAGGGGGSSVTVMGFNLAKSTTYNLTIGAAASQSIFKVGSTTCYTGNGGNNGLQPTMSSNNWTNFGGAGGAQGTYSSTGVCAAGSFYSAAGADGGGIGINVSGVGNNGVAEFNGSSVTGTIRYGAGGGRGGYGVSTNTGGASNPGSVGGTTGGGTGGSGCGYISLGGGVWDYVSGTKGTDATANTGSGGGGGGGACGREGNNHGYNSSGGAGASGIIIIRNSRDNTAPTCTLSADSTTITATASDNTGGSGLAYKGWSASMSGTNSTSKTTAVGDHIYYVKDNAGNTGMCSLTVGTPSRACPSGYSISPNMESYPDANTACFKHCGIDASGAPVYCYSSMTSYSCSDSQTRECPEGTYPSPGITNPNANTACYWYCGSSGDSNGHCYTAMGYYGTPGTLTSDNKYCIYK